MLRLLKKRQKKKVLFAIMHCQVHMEQSGELEPFRNIWRGTTFFGYYHNLYIRMSVCLYIEFSLPGVSFRLATFGFNILIAAFGQKKINIEPLQKRKKGKFKFTLASYSP